MTEGKARALWITGPGRAEIRVEDLPAPGPGEVLVRAFYSGISRGTESLVLAGRVPSSQYRAMRAPHQAGSFPAPVKYGYSNSGVVEAGPEEFEGRQVFCLYPHQDRYVVPAAAVVALPEGVPPGRAVLAANMETALNGVWDAAPRGGDHIAVVGAGVVGCLTAWLLAQTPGTSVQLIDNDPSKAAVARALGIEFAEPGAARDEANLVIHASGSPAGLVTALGLAGFEATILELSWFGDRAVGLPLGEAFHSKRLTLRASQVGHVAPARRDSWSRRQRLERALALLADPVLDHLISGESPFEALPRVLAALAESPPGTLCHRIAYRD